MKKEVPISKIVKIDWRRMKAAIAGIIIGLLIIIFVYFKFLRK